MRPRIVSSVLLLAIGLMAQPLIAQVDLTDNRTAEQKWNRTAFLMDGNLHGALFYVKSTGQTAEDYGRFLGEWAGQFWGSPGSMTMAAFVQVMYQNYRMYPDLEFEILAESDTEIQGRMRNLFTISFGEDGEWAGVTLDEFRTVFFMVYEGVADYHGFDMTHQASGEWVEFTVRTR